MDHIKKLEPPKNRAELQSVLGLLNYSKKFCRKYSDTAKPLYALLRKNRTFEWTSQCESAFRTLKNSLVTAPVLAFPNVNDPHSSYEVILDGSKYGYGATLTQVIRNKRCVIAYFSRMVQDHKKIWPQTLLEFECLYRTFHFTTF